MSSSERKEPNLGRVERAADSDRIPTLTDVAGPEARPGKDRPDPDAPRPAGATVHDPWAPAADEPAQLSLRESPHGGADAADYDDFIDELTRAHETQPPQPAVRDPDPEPAPAAEPLPAPPEEAAPEEAAPEKAAPEVPSPGDIEALADRVLDQLAPVLREVVAAAVEELLARRRGRS